MEIKERVPGKVNFATSQNINASLSALGFFSVDRSILTAQLSTIITYFIVIYQEHKHQTFIEEDVSKGVCFYLSLFSSIYYFFFFFSFFLRLSYPVSMVSFWFNKKVCERTYYEENTNGLKIFFVNYLIKTLTTFFTLSSFIACTLFEFKFDHVV